MQSMCTSPIVLYWRGCVDIAMAESTITFDLCDFYNAIEQNPVNIEEIEVPEHILRAIQEDLEGNDEIKDNFSDVESNTESDNDIDTSRFPECIEDDLDEITSFTNTKNTHAQTKWAVEVIHSK